MGATRFEYRFRFAIHGVIYLLGFWSPWVYWDRVADAVGFTDKSSWLVMSIGLSRHGLLRFTAAVSVVLVVALVLLAVGAWLRVWGSAYVGSGVVQSRAMHGEALLADGPYRHTRNPLYLGTLLHTVGISIVMPPSGAVFAVALLWVFQVRLAIAEEPFLAARFGQPYLEYKARVPRFLPSLAALIPAAGAKPQWVQAVLGELYFVGAFGVMAVFGWEFNAQPIRQGLLISLGVWMVVRALMPGAKKA